MKSFIPKILNLLILSYLILVSPVHATDLLDYLHRDESYFKQSLSAETYEICRLKATEKPGSGEYDKFYQEGTYYCACCGGDFPIYRSTAKFDSKTGWPSFTAPFSPSNVVEKEDDRLWSKLSGATTEITCARCGSHLGHVFNDGPPPTHKRYCMNSKALRFVPIGQSPVRLFPE